MVRKTNLAPVREFVAPEGAVPGPIQRVQCAVALFEPALESLFAIRVVAPERKTRLVVELPADDAGIPAVVRGQSRGDARARLQVIRAVRAVSFSPAVSVRARLIAAQNVRMLLIQPRRNRCRRGRENHVDSVMPRDVDRTVHPREIELSRGRFEECPREFPHADRVETQLAHLPEVDFPFRRLPPFGVVGCAQEIVIPRAPCTQGSSEGADPQERGCAIECSPRQRGSLHGI